MKPTILFFCISLNMSETPDFKINNTPFWYQKRMFFFDDYLTLHQEYIDECREFDDQFESVCINSDEYIDDD